MKPRRNEFAMRKGKIRGVFFDLFCKSFAVGFLYFMQTLLGMMGLGCSDKRFALLNKAAVNVCDRFGDKGLTRWFMCASARVFVAIFGPDNAYAVRWVHIFQEFSHLVKTMDEIVPDLKTNEYYKNKVLLGVCKHCLHPAGVGEDECEDCRKKKKSKKVDRD